MARKSRKKKLSTQDKRGLMILAGAIATIVVILGLAFVVRDDGKYDSNTLCPTNHPYNRTVVIVDKTDPFTPAQSDFLGSEVKRLRGQMAQSEKLAIYILNEESFAAPKPVFELCNPGTGSEANALYQNPAKIRLRFEERFGNPLDNILADLVKGQRALHSPIMEMIKNVSYRGDFEEKGVKLKLVLISDMLQHMPGFSQYTSSPSFEEFSASEYYRRIRTTLSGVSVQIVYFLRRGRQKRQTSQHVVFWEKFFADAGASLDDLRYGP